ncbi:MAG: methylated-DNA--[protein]-cysteine S-methyltransferase [Candidatus Heimdallarchaeota archaeon]|nr:methylated-DNA--[protein]-cysteine S-methyltransferase [Candidatus Heimdallarchaeota archaeon]
MEHVFYSTFPSPFDDFTIVWKENNSSIQIQRVFLSGHKNAEIKAQESFRNLKRKENAKINSIGEKFLQFFNGEDITFNLDLLDFERCSEIQKKVLLVEYKIPRGWISTYKLIAIEIGIPNGARVVGNCLAKNPFPIFIPCHRAIKSNGELGGYQGGLTMKQVLLEYEDIKFTDKTKIKINKLYFSNNR